ncbi:MAG: MarR family transcriptional regulator [Methanoregula sp.]|nr:MarR family transcriptional regulator [Methanoregula sp.]
MKEEDIDWTIYHLIPGGSEISRDELARKSGFDTAVVAASLDRLTRYLLIERTGDSARLLSIGESLIKCQTKYDKSLPFVIENGVIKERKN